VPPDPARGKRVHSLRGQLTGGGGGGGGGGTGEGERDGVVRARGVVEGEKEETVVGQSIRRTV